MPWAFRPGIQGIIPQYLSKELSPVLVFRLLARQGRPRGRRRQLLG